MLVGNATLIVGRPDAERRDAPSGSHAGVGAVLRPRWRPVFDRLSTYVMCVCIFEHL